jgi:hypothetical protein
MQLVLDDPISKLPLISDLDFILHKTIEIADPSKVRTIVKGRCPYSVKARWLSRCKALDWLLQRKIVLLHRIKFDASSKKRQATFRDFMTRDNFEKLAIYH